MKRTKRDQKKTKKTKKSKIYINQKGRGLTKRKASMDLVALETDTKNDDELAKLLKITEIKTTPNPSYKKIKTNKDCKHKNQT